MKLIGMKEINYTNKSGIEVHGYELHLTYEQKSILGLCTDRVFVSERAAERSECFAVGDEIKLSYNRFGKVDSVEVIKDAAKDE